MKTRNYLVKLLLVSLVITSFSNDDDSTEIISTRSIVGRVTLFDDNQSNIDNWYADHSCRYRPYYFNAVSVLIP